MNGEGNLNGLKLTLSADDYEAKRAKTTDLGQIGSISGDYCTELTLSGALDKIKVSYSPSTGVNAIEVFRGDRSKIYGNPGGEYSEW